jgi:hypothetical protein
MATNSFRIEFSGHPPMRWLKVHPAGPIDFPFAWGGVLENKREN